jgi:hypothetical protein
VAFKSIGTLASAVLREAELRAARQGTAANWNEAGSGEATASMQPTTGGIGMGGGTPVREDADVPPRRSNPRGQARATENGKGRGTVKATASWGRAVKMPAHGGIAQASTTAHLRLIVRNDGRGLPHAAAKKGLARPGSRPSIRIVGGRDHAALAKSRCSASAAVT